MVTGGALAAAGAAHADSSARGDATGSPGLLSGNSVQLPVHVPVNVCGNTVNAIGLLNPAAGNSCKNEGRRGGGAVAEGRTKDSPGVLSGNGIQVPVDVPVNVTGNSVNVVGVGNPSVDNSSSNSSKPPARPRPSQPPTARPVTPVQHEPQQGPAQLAETGTPEGIGLAVPAGAALILGGAVLYRRFRATA
ncbi:chaplin [Streptomyces formicae]|uniref:Chaplin n=2 Tax=Streptomyces formicae TaxID=1616117 RepID=A0ABY3WYR9_9ACTN|nr:chaplin [Streptomyces formicae]